MLTGNDARAAPGPHLASLRHETDPVLLFAGQELVDATQSGFELVPRTGDGSDWSRFCQAVKAQFVGLPDTPDRVKELGLVSVPAVDPAAESELILEWLDGALRAHIRPVLSDSPIIDIPDEDVEPDREVLTLRAAADASPFPAWVVLPSGRVGWYNAAYEELYRHLHSGPPKPSKPILQTLLDNRSENGTVRSSITIPGTDEALWFDVTVVQHDGMRIYYAQDINAVVRAEITQRNFVQTLSKTFAQLSTGLAIFNRERQLVLFNPALVDLTAQNAGFLSGRPSLSSFFDRLRDNQMMPEPKNYASWRDQIADLVEAAANGQYQETWSLPSGSVYQVSGRPHPDGAVAFLFEDITAEITLTRQFRSELELGHSILNSIDDSIAVFSTAGILVFSNAQYARQWSVNPNKCFADVTVSDAIRHWQQGCKRDSKLWKRVQAAIFDTDNRTQRQFEMTTRNGLNLHCIVAPLPGGATLVRFFHPGYDLTVEHQPDALTSSG